MYKIFVLLPLIAVIACGPSRQEEETQQQRFLDSLATANSREQMEASKALDSAMAIADSVAPAPSGPIDSVQ